MSRLPTTTRARLSAVAVAATLAAPVALGAAGPASAAGPTSPASPVTASAAVTRPPTAAMLGIFRSGWRGTGVEGEIALNRGSSQATGLPAGYRATVRTFGLSSSGGSLQSLCTPMVEKGTGFSPCTLLLSTSTVVLQQTIAPVAATPQTFTTLRLLRARPGGAVQVADLTLDRDSGANRAQLAAAAAWVADQVPSLTRVVQLSTPTR